MDALYERCARLSQIPSKLIPFRAELGLHLLPGVSRWNVPEIGYRIEITRYIPNFETICHVSPFVLSKEKYKQDLLMSTHYDSENRLTSTLGQ